MANSPDQHAPSTPPAPAGGDERFGPLAENTPTADTPTSRLDLDAEQQSLDNARQLRDTVAALQAVVDGANDAIFLKDADGRFLLFNRAAERFSGFTAAEVLGK